MVISDDARKLQVEIYKILVASYILSGKVTPDKAIERAMKEATFAALAFDRAFPTRLVDVTPAPASAPASAPARASSAASPEQPEIPKTADGIPMDGWPPGVPEEYRNGAK